MADEAVVAAALAAQRRHVFADTALCMCGDAPELALDWERHRLNAALDAAAQVLAPHAEKLPEMATTVLCCGQEMRYVYNRSTWAGKFGSGTETTETMRRCGFCQAELVVTFTRPS